MLADIKEEIMSYKLEKPLSIEERAKFIVEYNHEKGLRIEETDLGIYALEEWELLDGDKVIDNKEAWEEMQASKERERISKLSLTKRELFLCLYKALGITPNSIREEVFGNQEALIEFDYAEKYYRGNPLVETLGLALGLTPKIIDEIFISGGNPDVITNIKGGDGLNA